MLLSLCEKSRARKQSVSSFRRCCLRPLLIAVRGALKLLGSCGGGFCCRDNTMTQSKHIGPRSWQYGLTNPWL